MNRSSLPFRAVDNRQQLSLFFPMSSDPSPFPERPASPPSCLSAIRKDPRPALPPSWWRHGRVPLVALACSGFAADFTSGTTEGLGIGAALGILLYTGAFLILRTDLSRREQWFLGAMALLNAAAVGINLSPDSEFNLLVALFLPLLFTFLPRKEGNPYDPSKRYASWWKYKFIRLNTLRHSSGKVMEKLPLALSIVIGIILFLFFLSIFAEGNPIVASMKKTAFATLARYCSWMIPDAETFVHLFLWILGSLAFGIVARNRPCASVADLPAQPERPWLPSLPAISLLFINLAFLVNNGTDIAFLWRGTVPAGISQTVYLHEGADSIIMAAVLSGCFLLALFRPSGSIRASRTGKILGFALAAQTGLLAASVALRLYYQIKDFGFSPNRVTAGIYLLLGTCFLYLLFRYMAGPGNWRRYAIRCGALSLVFLCAAGFYSPSQLSGDFNRMTMDAHPDWYFSDGDLHRFELRSNIPFAMAVYHRLGGDTKAGANVHAMIREALRPGSTPSNWRSFNLQEWRRERQERRFLRLPSPTATATYGTRAWAPSSRPTGMRQR